MLNPYEEMECTVLIEKMQQNLKRLQELHHKLSAILIDVKNIQAGNGEGTKLHRFSYKSHLHLVK